MKLNKSTLKTLIKECIVELYDDEPRLMQTLVKESLVELTAKSRKRGPKRSKRPRGTNVPALQRDGRQRQQGRNFEDAAPGDLWESLATDTLNTTYRAQPIGKSNTPETGMTDWATVNSLPADDGPAMHLARQQQQMHMHSQQQTPAMLHAQQQQHIRQLQAAAQHAAMHGQQAVTLPGQPQQPQRPMPQMAPPTPSVFNDGYEPSPSQLAQQFQNLEQAPNFAQSRQPSGLPPVPDDLAQLGIGDMSAHLGAPAPVDSMDMNSALAALAADMNSGL